jgi:ABC-type glutathione transport system ATPase component
MTLLKVENLTLGFDTDEGRVTAIDDVSFELEPGEVMGLVTTRFMTQAVGSP